VNNQTSSNHRATKEFGAILVEFGSPDVRDDPPQRKEPTSRRQQSRRDTIKPAPPLRRRLRQLA
jgi:hypothetical protein